MTMFKRLALLGSKSALSVAKPRRLCSSYGLINRRQISDFTKNSNSLENSQYHSTVLQHEAETLRNDLDKMRTELRSEIEEGTNKHVMEIHATRDKFMSYCIGILASSMAVGIGVLGLALTDRI